MLRRTATVFTNLGEEALLLYSMLAQETLGRPFSYELTLLSSDENVDLSALLGQPIGVALELADGSLREFNGVGTHVSLAGELGRYVKYQVCVRPWLWLLGQRKNCRIFQGKTVPEVLQLLFREHGFSDFSSALSGHYRTWEYLVQYRESDLNFVSRLMEQEGIYYFFKHAGGKHTLVLADSYSAHEAARGYQRVPYYPPHIGERREEEFVSAWAATRKIRPGAFSAIDFNFLQPSVLVTSTLSKPNQHERAEYEVFDYPGKFQDKAEADQQAQIRLEELQADYDVVQGASNARGLSVGGLFELSGYPREDQNKEYLLIEATYDLVVTGYESGEPSDEAPDFRLSFKAIDSQQPYRSPRVTRKPRVEGPQTAIVVGQDGQEIWTDELGRVKLQFHWDHPPKRNEDSSCFVRVAQIWAGSGFGGIHLPRIGQEVIVDFLEGDPDRPIVTGRVYNKDNLPPYTLPENATQSGIKSRSSKGGSADNFNEIRFEDKKGSEELHLQAEKDMTTLVKNDQSTTILQNRVTTIGQSDTLHVTGDISVTIGKPDQPPRTSKMNVTGKHSLDASDCMDFQAPNHIKFTVGGSSITITPGGITISAGGGASISLDSKLAAAAAGKAELHLDAKVNAKSADGSLLTLDPSAFLKGSGGGSVLVDANVLSKSDGGSKVLVDASSVQLDATKVSGTGKTEVSLSAGGSSLKLTPASAALKGATTNVNGTGLVSISAALVKIN